MKTKKQSKPKDSNLTEFLERTFTVSRRDDPNVSATFTFKDDKWFLWDLLRPHEAKFEATIRFSGVQDWLREDAKLYIAHLWLTGRPAPNLLQQIMVFLRLLGRVFPNFTGRPIDLNKQHAKEFVRHYCALNRSPISNKAARREINNFMAFVRQQYTGGEQNSFMLVFPKSKTLQLQPSPLEQAQQKKISTSILSKLIDACAADLNAYFEAKRTYIDQNESSEQRREYQNRYARERHKRLKEGLAAPLGYKLRMVQLHARAIKAQALILAICVGRRAATVCNTRFDIKTERVEWTNESGQKEKVILIRFKEMKVRNIEEDVPCPDAFGELALHAIETAKELTAELRENNPQWKDFLFLVPMRKRKGAKVLTTRQLNDYINGRCGTELGIRQRYNIPADRITIHNFRATRATNAWMGGLQIHEVAYDLGHANIDMTIRNYIVGSEEDKRRFQECMDKGALSGALEDIIGGREMVQTRLSKRHVEIMRNQGRVVSPTRYGYCCLPSASGPCIRTTPCYIGPRVRSGGCDYHLLSPDALPALEEDRELLLANISTYEDEPTYRVWVQHQQIQVGVIEDKIKEVMTLKHRLETECLKKDNA